LSYASMGSNAIFNFLDRADILMVAEGLHIAESAVPTSLRGKTLAEAEIPKRTQCQVVALRRNGVVDTRPGANTVLEADARMVLVCTPDSEQRFLAEYGGEKIVYGNVEIADPAVH
ncbi:MAG: cation:proton antiporter regulatory subunit, partial [Chthoniobacteraceae bacterium]